MVILVIRGVDAECAQLKWAVLAPTKFAVLLFFEKFKWGKLNG